MRFTFRNIFMFITTNDSQLGIINTETTVLPEIMENVFSSKNEAKMLIPRSEDLYDYEI